MKLGDIITKEEFLRLAPLGLEAFYDGTTYGYCRANAEAFKKWSEGHGELPSELIPGYIIKSCPRHTRRLSRWSNTRAPKRFMGLFL